MFAWDVKQVLDFLKEKCEDNDQLSNKEITLKVTIVLALTASSRISALHILDLNHKKELSIMNLGSTSCKSLGEGVSLPLR